ncbi:MAG: type II toxin-antitoxin system VapC family toxin [Actinomycetes bacterium]
MIVDSSAILAILLGEPERPAFEEAIASAPVPRMSAASYLEAGIVIDAKGNPILSRMLDALLAGADIAIAPVTAEQAVIAREAYRDFGRGSGHPAGLNFGDCFSYALAKASGEPLLFKGEDFIHTDVQRA